jgi:outer membrane protein assembly factor BamB
MQVSFTAAALAAVVPALLLGASPSPAPGDWPQFRGPRGDGASDGNGLLATWAVGGPKELWRRPIGEGFSSVAVRGDRLYTMGLDGEQEAVLCLRLDDGELVWKAPVGPRFVEEFGKPRSTPAVDGERVYALSASGRLAALRAGDGAKVWEHDLVAELGGRVPLRGYAPSPVLDDGLLLLEVGGADGKSIVAFDPATGEPRWTALDQRPGYSTPIVVTIDGVKQYVFAHTIGSDVVALRPDGSVHWRFNWPHGPIAMPVFVPPNRVFVSTANDVGGVLLEVSRAADGTAAVAQVWASREMKNHFNTTVFHEGHLYGFDNATFKALDVATGKTKWAHRGFGKGSLLLADGLLLVLSDRGVLALVEASPEGYRELGRVQAMNGKSWTSPAIAAGRIILRDQDEIVAYDLRVAAAVPDSPGTATGTGAAQ